MLLDGGYKKIDETEPLFREDELVTIEKLCQKLKRVNPAYKVRVRVVYSRLVIDISGEPGARRVEPPFWTQPLLPPSTIRED